MTLGIIADDFTGAVMVAEAFLYPLWDSRIDVGHQVQSVDSVLTLARTDLRTATMLLDARCIAGDRALAAELVGDGDEPNPEHRIVHCIRGGLWPLP